MIELVLHSDTIANIIAADGQDSSKNKSVVSLANNVFNNDLTIKRWLLKVTNSHCGTHCGWLQKKDGKVGSSFAPGWKKLICL
jgi:hypothetical protein